MNAPQQRVLIGSMMAIIACMAVVLASHAQQPSRPTQPTKPTPVPTATFTAKPAAPVSAADQASIDAQREQIWNSPNMLRARAWLQDYCKASAKITPEESQQYMTELQSL